MVFAGASSSMSLTSGSLCSEPESIIIIATGIAKAEKTTDKNNLKNNKLRIGVATIVYYWKTIENPKIRNSLQTEFKIQKLVTRGEGVSTPTTLVLRRYL